MKWIGKDLEIVRVDPNTFDLTPLTKSRAKKLEDFLRQHTAPNDRERTQKGWRLRNWKMYAAFIPELKQADSTFQGQLALW